MPFVNKQFQATLVTKPSAIANIQIQTSWDSVPTMPQTEWFSVIEPMVHPGGKVSWRSDLMKRERLGAMFAKSVRKMLAPVMSAQELPSAVELEGIMRGKYPTPADLAQRIGSGLSNQQEPMLFAFLLRSSDSMEGIVNAF